MTELTTPQFSCLVCILIDKRYDVNPISAKALARRGLVDMTGAYDSVGNLLPTRDRVYTLTDAGYTALEG